MYLSGLDYSIIIAYFIIVLGVGLWISKLARNNLDQYFLGGNKIKWYFLGLSNASGMFDISGVMWTVTLLFIYGLKSAWIPWLWPVWNQIFVSPRSIFPNFKYIFSSMGESAPIAITATGGKYAVEDDRNIPDTMEVLFEMPSKAIIKFSIHEANSGGGVNPGEVELNGSKGNLLASQNGYVVSPSKPGQFQSWDQLLEPSSKKLKKY